MSNKKAGKSKWLFLVGTLIFLFLILFKFDTSSLISVVSDNISGPFFLFLSLLIIFVLVPRAFRFYVLFNHLFKEDKISLKDSLLLTGASFYLALATPSKVGDTARGLFLKERALEITAVTLIEYFFDIFIVICIAGCGIVAVYRQYLAAFALFFLIFISILVILVYLLKSGSAKRAVCKLKWFKQTEEKLVLLKSHVKKGLQSGIFLSTAFIFSCFFNAIYFLVFYLILHRLEAGTSVVDVLFSAGVGMFIGTLTFIPMGMGTRDASTYGLLCSIGTDPDIAISSVIIMRSLTIPLLLVSLACYFLAISRFNKRQKL